MVVVPASTREGADQGSTCTLHMRTRTMGLYNHYNRASYQYSHRVLSKLGKTAPPTTIKDIFNRATNPHPHVY